MVGKLRPRRLEGDPGSGRALGCAHPGHRGRTVYLAGDSAYFEGLREIGQPLGPELALLPIGAYHPESFRKVHMGPDQAVQSFHDLQSRWLVPMHHGTFKLSFEALDEPARWISFARSRQTAR